ncbi:MAG: hypothetical protein LQ346_008777 [Caloplaca aetnensis]|nr:MAG: hypothetical protein LQ346_008777 [Caloplaca aetnensis]
MSPSGAVELPDPTADLHWSDYRGAIHDIFAENAQRHPERLCVVETQSSKTPRREFTYTQINKASNQVAHHLLENGVERGDFVMIYAHREKASQEAGRLSEQVRDWISENLDLKTEIPGLMLQDDGSLIGGIIDGKDVLQSQANLADKLPGIVIGPDDIPTLSFTSGSEGRPKGVKGRHFSLAYYFPWMAKTFNLSSNDKFTMLSGIAHDPIQRDMFTPLFLGAQLLVPSREDIQHELLAEWMKREGATVTHLTPAMGQILVGGASTVFPSLHHSFFVGDILIKRDCRRLQELAPNVNIVNMFGTTETQRAVSYFAIPCRNQDPNFLDKMTEVIPAGRGMYDVQLLVVNREDKTKLCDVGETGEIYVRAGGLAEGYLGEDLAELTRTKFVENWFVEPRKWIEEDRKRVAQEKGRQPWRQYFQGPRDRLYRSGDLGRYMPSGDVVRIRRWKPTMLKLTFSKECTGRADSQVKIRGFRIELGEIDKWVSEHPLSQENVTLLRRDKDEEPTLVTYIVPNLKQWKTWLVERDMPDDAEEDDSMLGLLKRFRALRDDLRDYLKTKLPSYAVPTVILPLRRMPLNPNGKIDKPALPFPTADEISFTAVRHSQDNEDTDLSITEKAVANIWEKIIPHVTAKSLSPADSFFDIGGHSILAQYMLASVKKQWPEANLDIVTIIRHPTLRAFAAEIDRTLDPIGLRLDAEGLANGVPDEASYGTDASNLESKLLDTYSTGKSPASQPSLILLTGATGFLGAYIIRDLLSRPQIKVIAHVRAKSQSAGLDRIRETCKAYGIWSDEWLSRLGCVTGDLQKPRLGLDLEAWQAIADEADIVIHNGAKVHWVLPYDALKPANVLSTLAAMKLCATSKPKTFTFISSTSVLDTDHYVQMSEAGTPVPESDDLEGSRKGLGTGYGQSKWVSEYLIREAGKRGLRGTIVRPGYVTGDSSGGGKDMEAPSFKPLSKETKKPTETDFLTLSPTVTNTDDFLTRHLKGCVQLGAAPEIPNGINMVPVNHVARCVVACALHPSPSQPSEFPSNQSPNTTTTTTTTNTTIAQITAPSPRMTFTAFASALRTYGYPVPLIPYPAWRDRLVAYVEHNPLQNNPKDPTKPKENEEKEEHALLPLYHFVTGDLPAGTRAPLLEDGNTRAALEADGVGAAEGGVVMEEVVGRYLAFLVGVGFLAAPPSPLVGAVAAAAQEDGKEEKKRKEGKKGRGGEGVQVKPLPDVLQLGD